MASLIYDSTPDLMAKGTLAFAEDTFRVLLVTAAYTPDKATHTRRSDIVGEVMSDGYSSGGADIAVTVSTDTSLHRTDIALGGAEWPGSTITARGAVYYDSRGGAPEDDELVCYIDFLGDVTSIAGLFKLEPSAVRIANP